MDRRSYVVGRARADHCNVWTESEQVQGDRDIEKAQAQHQAPGPRRRDRVAQHGTHACPHTEFVSSLPAVSLLPHQALVCLSILLFYHVTKSAESTFLLSFLSQQSSVAQTN
jgi:hypothetical protein